MSRGSAADGVNWGTPRWGGDEWVRAGAAVREATGLAGLP
ncbi:MAG: hypothetical protein RI897_3021 [Verrucomicrobiota bacterium]|jgi:hypothetical protein